jgi:hypothetical protein
MLMTRAELLYGLKRFASAAAAYREAALKGGPRAGRAWLMAGYAAWQVNDIGASKAAFGKAAAYGRQKKAATEALRRLSREP